MNCYDAIGGIVAWGWMDICTMGGTHGVYLICNHWWKKKKYSIGKNKAWLITFISIWFAWILFRANNVYDVFYIIEALGGNNGFAWGCSMLSSKGYALSEIVLVFMTYTNRVSEFLYFQF